jgi:UDP-3-O-[3-hydroxymyristoyl] glucosamine N-acyltransferase
MTHRIGDIAAALGAEVAGDPDFEISGPAEPGTAAEDQLALAMDPAYADAVTQTKARAAIVWPGADWQALGLKAVIFAPRSRYAMSGVTRVFEKKPHIEPGIHPSAIIDPTAEIGENAAIGPLVVIGPQVRIGKNARILAHSIIAESAVIGDDVLLYQRVTIGARVRIGDRFIGQPGCVVGADGFSFVTPQPGALEEARATGQISEASRTQGFARINSIGAVRIGDDVEVGANTTIDRGTIADTTIGNGTKLDNLVQIGHNVQLGSICLICGQSGVAGSTVIGDRVIVGGHSAIADHLTVGSDVIISGKAGVASNVPSGRVMMGNPAMKMELNVASYKALRRLPRWMEKMEAMQKRLQMPDAND